MKLRYYLREYPKYDGGPLKRIIIVPIGDPFDAPIAGGGSIRTTATFEMMESDNGFQCYYFTRRMYELGSNEFPERSEWQATRVVPHLKDFLRIAGVAE